MIKKPIKCPTGCGSNKINMNEFGDIRCEKCGWINLRRIQKNAINLENDYKQ